MGAKKNVDKTVNTDTIKILSQEGEEPTVTSQVTAKSKAIKSSKSTKSTKSKTSKKSTKTADKVVVDDFDSALNATQHLINTGCKNIALFSSVDNLSIGKLRVEGYLQALKNNNIAINPNLIIRTDSEDDLKEKIEQVFDNNTIDGIFALDENDSVAALRIGLKKGYKIPEELSIIGFADGILASRRLSPSLSTLSQYGVEIGEVAANVLINRLDSKEENLPYETTVIKTQLRERESTRRL